MVTKKEKTFTSAKEVIQTYFPMQTKEKAVDRLEGYGSKAKDFIEKLTNDFETDLKKNLR